MGTGSSIQVLSDKWLPCHPTNKILVLPNEVGEDWHVSELIDWTTFQWNRDFIDTVFNRYNAKAIYRIPLSRRCVLNVMVWLHNKNGRYSMKFGYHTTRILLKESSQEGEGSNPRSSSKVWARIWKLHILNKIKVFGWRACHNILPTYERLQQRRFIENDMCPICKRFPETTIHALWEWSCSGHVGWMFTPYLAEVAD